MKFNRFLLLLAATLCYLRVVSSQESIESSYSDQLQNLPLKSSEAKNVTKEMPIRDIKIGDFIDKIKVQKGDSAFYRIVITENIYKDEDLVIKVIPLDQDSDPDIFISQSEKYPSNSLTSDWQCSSYGKDTCTINHKNLTKGSPLYIGVTCLASTCNFQLKSLLTSEFVLEDGIEFQTYLYKEDVRIFRFTIPPQISDNTSITIKASAYRGTVHDFTLTVAAKDQKDSPGTNFNAKTGISAWKKGQAVRINKDNFDGWCQGCEIKILLDVRDQGYYHIMAQTTDSTPLLQNFNQVDDIVDFDAIQCYKYFVSGEDTDVQIQIVTYSGRVSVQANPDTIPEKWSQYKIKSDTLESEPEMILDIRPWIRRHMANKVTGLYYICVKGELTSTYSLKLKEFNQNLSEPIELEDGFSEYFWNRGNGNMQLFLYKVPKLEYKDEDLKVEFALTVRRGNADNIRMAGAMCETTDVKFCLQALTSDIVFKKNSKYERAQKNFAGQQLRLVIDHDEQKCESQLHGECVYVIAVQNNNGVVGENGNNRTWGSGVRYKLVAKHSQNNQQLLQEGTQHIESVDMKTYKYFKFTLLEDDSKIENITLEISPLHGDCDLIISTNESNQFPTKENYDKISQRIGSLVDHIEFTRSPNSTFKHTYYIGVYGYTYTTFSLLITVNRKVSGKQSFVDRFKKGMTEIAEGFPFNKRLHNELDMFFGYFKVNIADNDEHAIIIDLQNTEGRTNTLIRYGEIPDILNYEIKQQGQGIVRIAPGDPHYHKQGTYYIIVLADFQFLDLFIDNYYTFSLSWRTEDTMPHLTAQRQQSVQIQPQGYTYFRHFVQETTDDIKISLMSKSGAHMDLYLSLGLTASGGRNPTNDSHDFSTRFMKGGNYMNAKSLLLPIALLQNTNSACKDFGYAEEDPCVLYIGIYCQETTKCEGEIELDYESKTPKKIYPGQTKHQIMQSHSVNYYYISVTQDSVSDIVAVLTSLVNDADLYVQIQNLNKTQLSTSPTGGPNGYLSWQLPNEANNTYESKTKLNTEMISIPRRDLIRHCGFVDTQLASMTAQGPKTRNDPSSECLIVFGIIPAHENPVKTQAEGDTQIHYNFAIYKDFMQLQPQTPTTGYIREGDFVYYLYKETCQKCNILISLVSQGGSGGDTEVYINKGLIQSHYIFKLTLPTKNEYDMKRNTLHSEVISISEYDTEFLKNATSMADYYVIGIFSPRNTTFQLSIASSDEPVTQLVDGIQIKHSQGPYKVVYFQHYHFIEDVDILIDLHVQQGSADVYVATFNSTSQNFVQRLPKRKNDAQWISEDVNSFNSGYEDKQVLIMQNDRAFCIDCYYVIGIVTHEGPCSYQLAVTTLEAEAAKSATHFMRLGMSKKIRLNNQTHKITRYQFMLDSKEPATLIPTLLSGQVKLSLSFGSESEAFAIEQVAAPIQIIGDRIRTEQNYYLYVEVVNSESAELTVMVQQSHTIQQLNDGHPQTIDYQDYQDVSKYLIYNLPTGNSTVVFFVKSKTKNFFPHLFVSQSNHRNQEDKTIFPPDEMIGYDQFFDWDTDLYAMKISFQYVNQTEGAFLAINLKYNMQAVTSSITEQSSQPADTEAHAQITVSHTQITKLPLNQDYLGDLSSPSSSSSSSSQTGVVGAYRFHLFALPSPPSSTHTLQITYSLCLGMVQVSLLRDPGQLDQRTVIDFRKSQGSYIGELLPPPQQNNQSRGDNYVLVEAYVADENVPIEYLIKVEYVESNKNKIMKTKYMPEDSGRIRFEYVRNRKGNVKIDWSPLYQLDFTDPTNNKVVQGVRYKLIFSDNPDAVMDSVCAIKRQSLAQSKAFTVYEDIDGDNEFMAELPRGIDTQFNVIAIAENDQVAVPYSPITLRVPNRPAYGGRLFVQVLIGAIVVFAFFALYFFFKNRKLQSRLHEEVRDISSSSLGGQSMSYRRVKDENQQLEM